MQLYNCSCLNDLLILGIFKLNGTISQSLKTLKWSIFNVEPIGFWYLMLEKHHGNTSHETEMMATSFVVPVGEVRVATYDGLGGGLTIQEMGEFVT